MIMITLNYRTIDGSVKGYTIYLKVYVDKCFVGVISACGKLGKFNRNTLLFKPECNLSSDTVEEIYSTAINSGKLGKPA